jgi:2-C-methyl-D-erythritol 2,4-cyclodiphosphate synthase
MMKEDRLRVVNVDITLIAQRPRMAPFFQSMRARLAQLLGVRPDRLNIKASTTEKLGWVGQGRGMAGMAVVLLRKS